jgi:hypothetical protein
MTVTNGLPKFTVHGGKMFYIITLILGFVPVALIYMGYKIAELVL